MTRREYLTQLQEAGKIAKYHIEDYYTEEELNSFEFMMVWVKNKNGHWCRFYKVMEMANEDIVKILDKTQDEIPWNWTKQTNQDYFETYAKMHKLIIGEEFEPWVNDY